MGKFSTEQLRQLRDDFGYFCRVILLREVHEMQLEAFTDPHRIVVLVGGRGAGKSTVGQMYCLWQAFRDPRHVVVWISSAEEQSEHSGDILRDFLEGGPLESYVADKSWGRVKFTNGSIIYFLPNSPRRARGFHERWQKQYTVATEANLVKRLVKAVNRSPSITLVIDESAEVLEAVYTASAGVLNTSAHSKALYMGSAKGKNSWFYKEYVDGCAGEGETKSYVLNAEQCPWVDQTYLAEMKRKMDDATYRSEFCGEFMDSLSAYFTPEMIANATKEYELPGEPEPGYELVLSLDLAPSERYGSDYNVIAVLGRSFGRDRVVYDDAYCYTTKRWIKVPRDTGEAIPPHIKLFYLARYQTLDHMGLLRELTKVKQMFPTIQRGVAESYESMQLDSIVYRVVRRGQDNERHTHYGRGDLDIVMEVIAPTNSLQHEAFSNLHQLIREGELWLPSEGEHIKTLRQELLNLNKEITTAGNVRWEAAKGYKDDCVYALLYGCFLLRRQRVFESYGMSQEGDGRMVSV